MIFPFPATFFARAHPMLKRKRKRREVKVENTACKLFDSLIIEARTKCGRAVSLRDLYRYQRCESALVARLRAIGSLPYDIRHRIESMIDQESWLQFRNDHKALFQTIEQRRNDLTRELDTLGCEVIDFAAVCEDFIYGCLFRYKGSRLWTAKMVAESVAQFKYVTKFCFQFRHMINTKKRLVNEKIAARLAEGVSGDRDKHTLGFSYCVMKPSTKFITGYDSVEEYAYNIAINWNDFPSSWPWLSQSTACPNRTEDTCVDDIPDIEGWQSRLFEREQLALNPWFEFEPAFL